MDYVISYNAATEMPILNFAVKNNVPILTTTDDVSTLFQDIPVSQEVTNIKKNLINVVENELFAKYSPRDFEIFLWHEGLGESTAFLFWLKKYREIYGKKILCICANNLRAELLSISPYVDAIVMVDWLMFDFISVYFTKKYNIHRALLAHFSLKTIETKSKLSADELKNYWVIDVIRDFLNISADTKYEPYAVQIPPQIIANVKNLFAQMNLIEGKTVLIVTEGYYYGGLGHHLPFWIKLRDKLNSAGYEVVINGNKEVIPGCRSIFLSLLESAAFAGLCGNIVSIPTGFVECIYAINSDTKINLQIIFPGDNDIYWRGEKKDVDKIVDDYAHYLNISQTSKKRFSCDKWGNDDAEDDLLLEKIVQKITERTD